MADANRLQVKAASDGVLWKLLLLSALAYMVWSNKISVVFSLKEPAQVSNAEAKPVNASLMDALWSSPKQNTVEEIMVEMPPGEVSNLTLAIDPGFAQRYAVPEVEVMSQQNACSAYIKRFSPVAVAEMRKYGIPASIILAQGLLESDAGGSRLAQKANNHFGIKCFSKKCAKGHCINQTDDSHKDFFVAYPNVWGSFRSHSEMLQKGERYRHLFDLPKNDHRAWARGLEDAGYATDPQYAEKLMAIIQNLKLERFDR
ncbi:MAG: glycoside hydrolase family 73 protein [Saprospiraceae bacterium]